VQFQPIPKSRRFRFPTGVGLICLTLIGSGCSSLGPMVIPRDRVDYLSSVAESWKEQTLLNVVRLRYGDAPSFLDISSVVSSYAVQGQISAAATVNSNPTTVAPWSAATIGTGLAYQDRPTISYTPLSGDKFTKSLLRPIPPTGIFQLVQAGFPADFVLQVTVRSLNGITNHVSVGGMLQSTDMKFYQLIDALRRLQLAGTISLRLEKRGSEDVGILVMATDRSPQVNQDLKFVMETLRLTPGKNNEITIAFGPVQRDEHELAVQSRSMLEVLIELASGIDVPAGDVAGHRTLPSARLIGAENPRDRPLVRILSGSDAPSDAFSAIRYRNRWYWIDDGDFASKRIFTMLMIFFSLAETGVTPQAPALTIPLN
jgi:hypothetical protein